MGAPSEAPSSGGPEQTAPVAPPPLSAALHMEINAVDSHQTSTKAVCVHVPWLAVGLRGCMY